MHSMALVNLISNALKYTRPRSPAEIEIGWMPGQEKEIVVFVRDNGVGFDMNYVDNFSASSSVCTTPMNSKVPALAWPMFGGLSPGMAEEPGPKEKSITARRFTFRSPI